MDRRKFVFFSMATTVAVAGCVGVRGIDMQGVGKTGILTAQDIPRRNSSGNPFKSYALFIATNNSSNEVSAELSKQFDNFGDAIGDSNLAVFLSNPRTGKLDVGAGRTMLDQVSKKYAFKADYADGPFVLILPKHPSEKPGKDDHAVIVSFAGEAQSTITASLSSLRGEVLRTAKSHTASIGWARFWGDVLSGFNVGTGGLGNTRAYMS